MQSFKEWKYFWIQGKCVPSLLILMKYHEDLFKSFCEI